jgi:WD40 repeat protein
MGEERTPTLLLCVVLGCGSSAGQSGGAGESAGPDEVRTQSESGRWVWIACGTIPSTPVSGVLPEYYEPGQAIVGGHPYSSDLDSSSRMTALAMSADGQTLVSMGGATLVWDVAPAFADSRATYVHGGTPEWPRVDISPDGRWISIFGDGRLVISRDGTRGPWLAGPDGDEGCWPAEAKFSPDGTWLVGASFGPGIDVFRTADLVSGAGTEIHPVVSLPAPCGPSAIPGFGSTTRVGFTPDGQTLVTETGAQYRTVDWQLTKEPQREPTSHGYNGALAASVDGTPLLSDCSYDYDVRRLDCTPSGGRFPAFSRDGSWLLAGGTLTHLTSGGVRVLDATAPVGIFTPNGDVIAAAYDSTLTRYCLSEPTP